MDVVTVTSELHSGRGFSSGIIAPSDGGVWANNPTGLAVVEAVTILLRPGTSPHAFRIPLTVNTLPSEELPAVAPAPPWLYPAFAFVPV